MVVYAGLAGGLAYVAASRDAWGLVLEESCVCWFWGWSLVSLGDQRRVGLAVGARA